MSQSKKSRELPDWVRALLLFGAGFAAVWHCSSHRRPRTVGTSQASPEPALDAIQVPSPAAGDLGVQRSPDEAPAPSAIGITRERADATDIRKSRLPEWMRFLYEHSQVAASAEMAVRFELDAQMHVGDAKVACARPLDASVAALDISARIEIHGRDVTIRGWGCDVEHDDASHGAMCDCFLELLPSELHVVLPPEVPDAALVPYDGLLSLRL